MVDERTAYWGARDDARYRTQDDDPTGGDYVVAETLDANGDPVDVLLRWDDTAGEWVSGGPVNMSGSDVTNVGALDADSVSTDDRTVNQYHGEIGISSEVTLPNSSFTQIPFDTSEKDERGDVDLSNNGFTVSEDGTYNIWMRPTINQVGGANQIIADVLINGSRAHREKEITAQSTVSTSVFSISYESVELNLGDNIKIEIFQDSGDSAVLQGPSSDYRTVFKLSRVA